MKFNMKKAAALLLAGSMVAGYAVPAAAEAEEKVVTAAMDQAGLGISEGAGLQANFKEFRRFGAM